MGQGPAGSDETGDGDELDSGSRAAGSGAAATAGRADDDGETVQMWGKANGKGSVETEGSRREIYKKKKNFGFKKKIKN